MAHRPPRYAPNEPSTSDNPVGDIYHHPAVGLRVVLAEDSALLREGIEMLLGTEHDLDVVASCNDLDTLLACAAETRPDVVLTDIRMPPHHTDEGIRAATALRATQPDVGVVVLSQFAEPAYALELFDPTAQGRAYLLKDRVSDRQQLTDAIRSVAAGGSVIDPKVVELLVQARRAPSPLAHLTPREREVLTEIAQGKNNAAIASSLVLSERAVGKHINSLFAKLGLAEEPHLHRRVKAVLLFLADNSR